MDDTRWKSELCSDFMKYCGWTPRVADIALMGHMTAGCDEEDGVMAEVSRYIWDHLMGEPDDVTPEELVKDFKYYRGGRDLFRHMFMVGVMELVSRPADNGFKIVPGFPTQDDITRHEAAAKAVGWNFWEVVRKMGDAEAFQDACRKAGIVVPPERKL